MKYVFALFSLFLASCFSPAPEKTNLEGRTLPEFSFLSIDSVTWINTKEIKPGNPSVFFVFSPSCPYCKSQIAKITNDNDLLQNVSIYMVTLGPFEEMKHLYGTFNLGQYKNIQMGQDTSGFFGKYMDVKGVPFLALYDKNKRLVKAYSGIINTNLIKAILVD